jgi:hypothetical protein
MRVSVVFAVWFCSAIPPLFRNSVDKFYPQLPGREQGQLAVRRPRSQVAHPEILDIGFLAGQPGNPTGTPTKHDA